VAAQRILDGMTSVHLTGIVRCTIRVACAEDIATLADLERRIFGPDAYSADVLRRLIEAGEDARVLVAAAEGGHVVACGIAQAAPLDRVIPGPVSDLCERHGIGDASGVIGYLKSLAVSEEHRRRGLGTALTRARLDWLRTRETRHVFAFAWPGGTYPAFAARLGFTCLGDWPAKTYANGAVAMLFHRVLNERRP
jgi:predicted N-acetyltransferase YhbS